MNRFRKLAVLLALTTLPAACVSSTVPPLPDPPEVEVPPTSSSVPDFSGTSLPPVSGSTTTQPVNIRPGTASLFGRVTIGGAPAAGATVRVERLVDDRAAALDIVANAEGNWAADNLIGGRFRVRAFRPPDSTMTAGEVLFLGATERRNLDLAINPVPGGIVITANMAPDAPEVGDPANIVVALTTRTVDASGVVRSVPVAGVLMTLVTGAGRPVLSPNPIATNASGRAQWQVLCTAITNQDVTLVLADGTQRELNLDSCRTPTTTTIPGDPA